MDTDTTTENVSADVDSGGEGEPEVESITIPKKDYDKLNQTIGSLKRSVKDLQKPKETPETPQTKPEDNALLQKMERMALRTAGITHPDDVDLARTTAKKWGMDIDEVIEDDDFKVKLERQQTARDNAKATSNIRGGTGSKQANLSPEYWIAKGTPPSREDVPDRKLRAQITRQFLANAETGGKKFYND